MTDMNLLSKINVDKTDLLPKPGVCGLLNGDERIVGGNMTEIDEYPWMALLEYQMQGIDYFN